MYKRQVLGYARHSGLGKYTRNFFKEHGVLPNFICESPDENGIASLVAKDFGIALVADVDTIHRDDICIRPLISQETFSHTVYMGYKMCIRDRLIRLLSRIFFRCLRSLSDDFLLLAGQSFKKLITDDQ